jgi:hypothetical protein
VDKIYSEYFNGLQERQERNVDNGNENYTPVTLYQKYLAAWCSCSSNVGLGRAIVQAVSRRLRTAAARVRVRVRSCGICDLQSGTGARFLRGLRFPLPIRIPPIASQSSSTIWGWYNRPNSGRGTKWTQSHPHENV